MAHSFFVGLSLLLGSVSQQNSISLCAQDVTIIVQQGSSESHLFYNKVV